MALYFMEFEIPLLKALVKLGGRAKPANVYPEVERIMELNPKNFPEEYEKYKSNAVKWKNKTAWARVSETKGTVGRLRTWILENHRTRQRAIKTLQQNTKGPG